MAIFVLRVPSLFHHFKISINTDLLHPLTQHQHYTTMKNSLIEDATVTITSMTMAALSLIASSTMIAMIFRSRKKLKVCYSSERTPATTTPPRSSHATVIDCVESLVCIVRHASLTTLTFFLRPTTGCLPPTHLWHEHL